MDNRAEDRKDQRRQHIVATARGAFLRTGYGGTTMSAIAKRLGGSKTTLWTYFRNKYDLFSAVVDDLVDQYGEALRLPLPEDGDVRSVLTALAQSLMTTLFQPEIIALHRMVTGEAARFPELGVMLYERGPARGHKRMADWLARQMDRGILRQADSLVAARHFSALCQSGGFQRYLIGACPRPDWAQLQLEIEQAVDAFFAAYGAREPQMRLR